tara:strand:- start:1146 stop:1250 length:105 start_codon:yes stop_codon:yes gene_type:complete
VIISRVIIRVIQGWGMRGMITSIELIRIAKGKSK